MLVIIQACTVRIGFCGIWGMVQAKKCDIPGNHMLAHTGAICGSGYRGIV